MRKYIIVLIVFVFQIFSANAQELNCVVTVNSSQIQSSDKKVFETLQTSIRDFMNNRKWTNDQFLNQERIECSILINITERVSSDEFKATIQVQSRRPIFKSSYNSTLINFMDNDFNFRYLEFQPLDYNENSYTNLTFVLGFYANLIIGFDYETFSPDGGTYNFQKCQTLINNSQNAPEKGWKAFENTKNRYWILENLNNPILKPIRTALYKYHRQGLDLMSDNKENARAAITEALEGLKKVYAEKPGALLLQMFFNAKSEEIVHIYSQAFPEEKTKIVNTLTQIDPANSSKYQEILTSQ